MTAPNDLSPVLAGPLREEAVVGEGAAGRVSRARAADGRTFALKRFADPALGERELSVLRRVDRRFGPRCLGARREGGELLVALEWTEGEPLDHAVARTKDRARLAAIVAHGVGRGLAELHGAGVRHGDVKPANVLVHAHEPARDAAVDRGATLIDLSLASEVAGPLLGATLAYLAPEARADAHRVGPETDLYALGCVLREIVGGADVDAGEPSRWIEALLAPAPGGRPSAAFIANRAARFLALADDIAERQGARRAAVRRAYLRARERDLDERAPCRIDAAIGGAPRQWLEQAAHAIDEGAPRVVAPLDAIGRARWLTQLFGTPPPEGIDGGLDESALAERLLAVAEHRDVFVYADLAREPVVTHARGALDLVSAAVALAQPRPPGDVLAWAEHALDDAPTSFVCALAEALVRVGEIGRAWLVVARGPEVPEVLALRAEIARRRGDAARAERDAARAGAHATLARVAWDRGDFDEAERVLERAANGGSAAAEVRGLVAYARGAFDAGLVTIEAALAQAPPSGARARLEAVRGMLHHGRGDAAASARAFAAAVDHASSASIVEEATYLTGLAAAAADVGDVARALSAATRAALLWERLDRPEQAARAWLARASALSLVGATHEARSSADEAIRRAERRGDAIAAAYGHLVHVETRAESDDAARAHLVAALAAVPNDAREPRLRVEAHALGSTASPLSAARIAENDDAAAAMSVGARWEWWGARARVPPASVGESRRILAALSALLASEGPAASRAPALRFAGVLARAIGDGEAARRFESARRVLAATIRAHVPPELASRLATASWMIDIQPDEAGTPSLEPAQIGELEALVRSLGARDRLGPLLNQVLDALLLWTGVERGLLLLRAPDGGLVPRAGRNLARADLEGEQRALSLGIAKRALELGDVVVATDAFASLGELHASVHALRLRSVLAVPLIARGEALGVVYLDDRLRRGAFGPREIAWVRLVATHAALAVADARDAVRLRRAVRHAERAKAAVERELTAREMELDRVKAALDDESAQVRYQGLAGRSPAMRRTLHMVARVAGSDVPVLLVGESGTGKELLARAVHETGPRRAKPFVTENCGAVPEALLESILFGHKRGAFTGATATKPGLFEVADGGTLFLDEIGEMSPPMQSKLLRVLQDGEIRAVGDDRTRRVDVRILAATHRDLEAMVKSGAFREDLFYRLNVVRIDVPALRERAEDIPALVAYLLAKHAPGRQVKVTRAAMDRLCAHPWPGNVRQLENELRRALVLAGDRIDASELSPELLRSAQTKRGGGSDLRGRLDALEAELVEEALEKTRGNQTKAAELLGVSRFGLQKMIKRLGLRVPT